MKPEEKNDKIIQLEELIIQLVIERDNYKNEYEKLAIRWNNMFPPETAKVKKKTPIGF